MTLWWIGNALFLLVVIPVVVVILTRLMRPALEVKRYADDLAEHGGGLVEGADPLRELEHTRELASRVAIGLERYRNALDEVL